MKLRTPLSQDKEILKRNKKRGSPRLFLRRNADKYGYQGDINFSDIQ